MSKSFIKIITPLFLLFFISMGAFAQSKQDLQQKKKKLMEEIRYTNKLLKETEKSKKTTLNQLKRLNKKISSREHLIVTMEEEISMLSDSIDFRVNIVDSLEEDLEQLKSEYAEMVRNAYKDRNNYNKLMFVFAADNFNQAFRRLKYFQQYARYRENQASKIKSQQAEIDDQILILSATKQSKEGLLQAKLNEKNVLASEKNKQESVVSSFKGKERQLKKQLKQKEQASRQITKAIERIIAEEIRKAREAAKKAGNSAEGFPMTPEARELSNSFEANKGKLPWPVEEGVVTGLFGLQSHPTLKGVKVSNNGIDISTSKESMGRTVFKGTISSVVIIPGNGKAVIINHGNYFTTYGYFKEVFVSSGDKVETKQNLGVLVDDEGESSATLHLEIWKVRDMLNPEKWIFKK